jgi:hypothetical protein
MHEKLAFSCLAITASLSCRSLTGAEVAVAPGDHIYVGHHRSHQLQRPENGPYKTIGEKLQISELLAACHWKDRGRKLCIRAAVRLAGLPWE